MLNVCKWNAVVNIFLLCIKISPLYSIGQWWWVLPWALPQRLPYPLAVGPVTVYKLIFCSRKSNITSVTVANGEMNWVSCHSPLFSRLLKFFSRAFEIMGDNILNRCNGNRPSLCDMTSLLVQAVSRRMKIMTLMGWLFSFNVEGICSNWFKGLRYISIVTKLSTVLRPWKEFLWMVGMKAVEASCFLPTFALSSSSQKGPEVKSKMGTHNLWEVPRGEQKRLLELEEKQLYLLDTIKRLASIRVLRRVLGLKFKRNRPTGEINVYGSISFRLIWC